MAFIQYLHFKHFSLVFIIIYVVLILFLLASVDWDSSTSLNTNYHIQRTEEPRIYKPRRPPLNETRSDGCHFAPDSLRKPAFTPLGGSYFLNAFYDTRLPDSPQILVLALRRLVPPEVSMPLIYCLVNEAHNHTLKPVRARHINLPDYSTRQQYQTFLLVCPVVNLLYRNPCKVRLSLTLQLRSESTVTLPLLPLQLPEIQHQQQQQQMRDFAVCVPPIHGTVSQSRLVEFMELQRILGADHVYIYSYTGDSEASSVNPNVEQVLRYYNSTDLVTVYNWQLPFPSQRVARYAVTAAMHHCLYSNMLRYRYLLISDVRSILFPQTMTDWRELMMTLDDGNHIAFCYSSAFFPPKIGESETTISMSSTQRTDIIKEKPRQCIVKPAHILQMSSSDVLKWGVTEDHPVDIAPQVALSHCYQRCGSQCGSLYEDESALRYKRILRNAHSSVLQTLLDHEELDD